MKSPSCLTLRPLAGRTARILAVPGFLLVAFATLAGVIPGLAAQAAEAGGNAAPFKNAVTFIGDSVTAGFGFCGVAENASGVRCRVNQQMANSWDYEYTSLDDCAPPSPPAALNDACSNDNNDGSPWDSPPWTSGPGAPDYETLLAQGDRVLVLGYYRNCPWSFGNWQPGGRPGGGVELQ